MAAESTSPRESLATILSVESRGSDKFTARLEDFFGESLPGDALARAVLAAAQSGIAGELHSLHAHFMRPAPPAAPLTLHVERLDDRRGVRRVEIRGEALLCEVIASFASASDGPTYQDVACDAQLPAPEKLPSTLDQARAEGWADYARGPIEFRRVGSWPRQPHESSSHVEWVRPRVPLPDDPRLHAAALVFLSAFYIHWGFERRVGPKFAYDRFQPVDHALWVHRLVPWNDWWLLKATNEVGHGGRALGRREIYTRDGQLIASVAHEALIATTA